MKSFYIILAIILLSTSSLLAQNQIDLFGISFIHNPEVGLKDPQISELENIKLNVTELDAFVKLPIQLKNDKTVLINGLKWHYVKAPFDDFPNAFSFEAKLHSIQYDLTIIHKLSDSWDIMASVRPTLASNFRDGISSDDFFFQGLLAFQKAANERTTYGFGISYSNGFGEPKTVPILLLKYEKEKVKLDIIAPVSLKLKYLADKLVYGFNVLLEGGQFHLSSKVGDGPIITNMETIKFSRYNLGPAIGWRFDKSSRIEVSGGISLLRTLKAVDNSGVEEDYDLKNGLFLKAAYYFGK